MLFSHGGLLGPENTYILYVWKKLLSITNLDMGVITQNDEAKVERTHVDKDICTLRRSIEPMKSTQ